MKRVFLYVVTNLAVLLVLSFTARLLGVDRFLTQQGLNLNSLLVFSALIGFGGSFISLAMSKWSAKMMTGAQVITQPSDPTERWLLDTVQRQARAAGVGAPEVAIFDAAEPNAFATGINKDNALVAVSSGLLYNMSKDEVEAVLGHEMTHVSNGDMVTLGLVQGVVNTFVIFLSRVVGYVVDRVVLRSERDGPGPGFWIASIVAELVLGILASMIVMWFSRQREFRADAGGARLAGREKMIAALEALKRGQEQTSLPPQMAAFGISGGGGLTRLFMSHPPLDERIDALRRGAYN
jgi:heat shock protein HtpX